MSKFSEILYKCPGNQHGPNGKTFTWIGVTSEEQLKEKLKEGWCKSLAEACGLIKRVDKKADGDAPDNDKVNEDKNPPTRAELEEQAQKMGITFSKRIKDKNLAAKIEKALVK